MIIAKKLIKIICVFLPMIFIFSSCAGRGDSGYPYLELITFGSESESQTYGVYPEYRMVVSSDASAELYGVAGSLCEEIENVTGCPAYLVNDREEVSYFAGTVEIILGNANREHSKITLYGMRSNDYTCVSLDGAIVIGGRSESATLTAIERFRTEILPAATHESLMSRDGGFSFSDDYAVGSYKLNGYELSLYDIAVEDWDNHAVLQSAISLRDAISDRTGYYLDVIRATSNVGRAITVGKLNETLGASYGWINATQSGITVCARDVTGVLAGMDRLYHVLLSGELSGNVSRTVGTSVAVEYEAQEYVIATLDTSRSAPYNSPAKITAITAPVIDASPSAVFYGALDATVGGYVSESLFNYLTVSDVNESVFSYAKSECVRISTVVARDAVIEAYFIGEGASRFSLIVVSGAISDTDIEINIPPQVTESGLPIVIIGHTSGQGGMIIPDGYGISAVLSDRNAQGAYVCYATDATFEISPRVTDADAGYRDISIKRIK